MTLALALALSVSPLSFAALQGDLPTVAYDEVFGTQAAAVDHGLCAASNGDLTVIGGELRDGYSTTSTIHVAFVRAVERTTGVERWRHVNEASKQTLAVEVDATAQRVYAIQRATVDGSAPGSEHLLVLDGATGNVLLDVTSVLPAGQPLSNSDVDGLALSPAGDVLYRLDFYGSFTNAVALVRAYDTQTGALLWSDARYGLDGWEYRRSEQNESLSVSPDGATIYVSFETVDPQNSSYGDTHVLSLSAIDGSENWVRSLGTAGVIDRASRPVVTLDSSGVFVATEALPPGPSYGPLLRLDAVDGSTQWSAPVDFLSFAIALSPNGARVAVGGWDGDGNFPNGTDTAVHCFDAATGTALWAQSYPTADLAEDAFDMVFSPDSSALHVAVVRNQMLAPFQNLLGLVTVRAGNGLLAWQDTYQVNTTEFVDNHWLDAAATSPTTSIVALGQTVTDLFQPVGLGNDQRRAYDGDTGALAWNFTVSDLIPQHSDAAFRVWFEPGDAHFLVWRREAIANGLQQFRLDRRDAQSGALVASLVVPDIGAVGAVFFKPNVSPDGAYVAIERGGSAAGRRLSVYEIATGVLVFERDFGSLISEVLTTWDPNAPRVHWATRAAVGYFGCADVQLGQTLFEVAVNATGPFGGAIVPQGLAVHPVTGDQVASYESIPYLNPPGTNFIVARDGDTGAVLWSFSSANTNRTRFRRDHRDLSNLVTQAPYEELTTLCFSVDGTRLFATDTYQASVLSGSRGAAFDSATGNFLWIAGESNGLGYNGRTIDCTVSKDGRFLHVLGEGRGSVSTDPMRTHVTTIDTVTGALVWAGRLSGDNARARRIESLGTGGRVAVLATTDTDAASATGGYLAVLDAVNGVELWRHEHSSTRGDLCDFAVAADEAVVLVGSTHVGGTNVDALVRRIDRTSLEQGPDQMSLSGGGHVEMHLDFDVARAGDIHVLVGTLSGTSPGLSLANGFVLPLNYDAYTDISLAYANSPLFVNSIGVLDAAGDGRTRVFVPPGSFSGFAGLPFSYAALAIDPATGVSATSNPVFLTMLP